MLDLESAGFKTPSEGMRGDVHRIPREYGASCASRELVSDWLPGAAGCSCRARLPIPEVILRVGFVNPTDPAYPNMMYEVLRTIAVE